MYLTKTSCWTPKQSSWLHWWNASCDAYLTRVLMWAILLFCFSVPLDISCLLTYMLLQEFLISMRILFAFQFKDNGRLFRRAHCWVTFISFKLVVNPLLVSKLVQLGKHTSSFGNDVLEVVYLQDWQDNKLIASVTMLEFGYLHNREQ